MHRPLSQHRWRRSRVCSKAYRHGAMAAHIGGRQQCVNLLRSRHYQGHPCAGAPRWCLTASEAVISSSTGSSEATHIGCPTLMHRANASRTSSCRLYVEAREAAAAAADEGAAMVSLAVFLRSRCRQRQREPPAPSASPCTAPSGLIGPSWGTVWEAVWLSPRAEGRGWVPTFSVVVAEDLGCLQSLAMWQKPWQRMQHCGNRQVSTLCE
jgi:hypothetical protein